MIPSTARCFPLLSGYFGPGEAEPEQGLLGLAFPSDYAGRVLLRRLHRF
jgi:hypothetical protein